MSAPLIGVENLVWTVRKFLMLKAYIDDSCVGKGPVYVLGGGLADGSTWAKVSAAWDDVLRIRPRIKYFKFEEAVNLKKQFSGISEESPDEKMLLLYELLQEYKVIFLSCSVREDVFTDWYSRLPDESFSNPYILLLLGIARRVIEHCRLGKLPGPVDFHFDSQPISAAKVYTAWEKLLSVSPLRYKRYFQHPPNFHNDQEVLLLQVADFIVGLFRTWKAASLSVSQLTVPKWRRALTSFTVHSQEMNAEIASEAAKLFLGPQPIQAEMEVTFSRFLSSRARLVDDT